MTGPNNPTNLVPNVSTGQTEQANRTHRVVNQFDMDGPTVDGQVPKYDIASGLYKPALLGTGLDVEGVRDTVAAFLTTPGGSRITLVHDDAANTLTISINASLVYIDGLIATGQFYTVLYSGSAWPALSTVPAAYISTGRPIIWNSEDYLNAPEPPEGRDNDRWEKRVAA